MKKTVLVTGMLALICGVASAKLPAPDDAAKAKAAEAAAKAAWQGKVDAYQLCKSQDKVVAAYMKTGGKSASKEAQPAAAVPASVAQPAASGTPVASRPPPCADPGPFAYNPPEQKPLETSGAHSPPGTAANPPSVKAPSAEMAPPKK